MTNSDFPMFCNMWGQTFELFNRQLSEGAFNLAFNALSDLTLQEVTLALSHVVKTSKFAPTVADVRCAVDEMRGEDKHTLEQKANKIYNLFNAYVNIGRDIVCDDARAVYAFKRAFGSLKEFGSHAISADPFDRKAFIELYVNAKPEYYEKEADRNLIKGIYHDTSDPQVSFIGNAEECKKLAKVIYINKSPRLPAPVVVQIEHKQQPVCKQDVDLDEMLKELNQLLRTPVC